MDLNDFVEGLKDMPNGEVTLKINNHYYDVTEVYYDGYLDEIIIEHRDYR